MPTESGTPTLAEIVRAGAEAADPDGSDPGVSDLVVWFEDRDEPVTAIEDVDELLAEAQRSIDLDGDSEPLATAVQVATYLAFRRDQLGTDREELIRLAERAEQDR